MNLRCRVVGHRFRSWPQDYGYRACARCGRWEYHWCGEGWAHCTGPNDPTDPAATAYLGRSFGRELGSAKP